MDAKIVIIVGRMGDAQSSLSEVHIRFSSAENRIITTFKIKSKLAQHAHCACCYGQLLVLVAAFIYPEHI